MPSNTQAPTSGRGRDLARAALATLLLVPTAAHARTPRPAQAVELPEIDAISGGELPPPPPPEPPPVEPGGEPPTRPRPEPVRVHVVCESVGRTKACPTFLRGVIDAHGALTSAPRASADVLLFVHATAIASTDRLHLRFTSRMANAPESVEFDVDLDSRAADDPQLAALRPAFLRGISHYVAARFPELVEITLAEPTEVATPAGARSPWGLALTLGGWGSWTERYQSYSAWSTLEGSRLTRRTRTSAAVNAGSSVTKQPPLITPDGTELSLDTSEWWLSGGAVHVQLLSEHWSIGGETNVWTNDDKGQYRYGWDAKLGLEWDKFAADDPRGNALAVAYIAGYQLEAYNLRNELGQTKARYPKHELQASGSIRRDKITYGLSLKVGGALLEPDVRHYVSAAPSMTWNLGDHVTLSFDAAITKRELPGPHPDELDNADYELISRASYAEPISLSGSLNLRVFWDRSNDALNDRLDDM